MTTSHKATRLQAGQYLYRGWECYHIEGHWNLTPPNQLSPTDGAATLKEAKIMIDRMEGEK